jgi:hypothetical protein
MDNQEEYNEAFDNGDFVFIEKTKENGEKEFVGGGYKINSFFLKEGISPITTYNTNDLSNTNEQSGGKVSSPFENLAVPAGLFYVNMKIPKYEKENVSHYKKHDMLPDDIMDKLYSLVEIDKKRKRKTRKQVKPLSTNKSKTRKQI